MHIYTDLTLSLEADVQAMLAAVTWLTGRAGNVWLETVSRMPAATPLLSGVTVSGISANIVPYW